MHLRFRFDIHLHLWSHVGCCFSSVASQVLLGELPSTNLRSKTIAIATCAGWLCDTLIICGIPYLLSPTYANLGAKVEFIFGACQVVVLLWIIFFLPETKDGTLEELVEMFMNVGMDYPWH